MERIEGNTIFLRSLVISDLEVLLRIENNKAFWYLSDTTSEFSEEVMLDYLANAQEAITKIQQYRFAICDVKTQHIVGLVDLYDYDALHQKAGVGILIEDTKHRKKGYATEALSLLLKYAKEQLGLHQLYANILEENTPSISLFEKQGFQQIGNKIDWRRIDGVFKNELLYQYIM